MPGLTAHERDKVLGPTERICKECRSRIFYNYCREHDEFYNICKCHPKGTGEHKGHRTYQCQNVISCPLPMERHCPKCDKYLCSVCALHHNCGVPMHWLNEIAYMKIDGADGIRDDDSGNCICSLMSR